MVVTFLPTACLAVVWHERTATPSRLHGAGAAQAGAAAELGTGHLQLVADDPEQGRILGRVDLARLAVMVSVIMFPPWRMPRSPAEIADRQAERSRSF